MLHPDRLLPSDPEVRRQARRLYDHVRSLPIVSPHGHCDAQLFGDDLALGQPSAALVIPDHYLLRMLYSQGVPLSELGLVGKHEPDTARSDLDIWRTFAANYHLFRATPSKAWLDHTIAEVFHIDIPLNAETADEIHTEMDAQLSSDAFRPSALLKQFNIELLATTDGALSPLDSHRRFATSNHATRVVPTFRPDDVVDPDRIGFRNNLDSLAEITGIDTTTWDGYLEALRARRQHFIDLGATASDHGHPTALTLDLPADEAKALFARIICGSGTAADREAFRAQMLVEMAAMSVDDGLVLQLHTGSWRNHNSTLYAKYGADVGADIPTATDYVGALRPLLEKFGNDSRLTVVLYTLDETTYTRELAPLAGHYPAIKLGAPWWFHDSPEGMRRFRRCVTETAGFANTVGFNDDARSVLTIPARHDVARRIDAGYLAELLVEHRLTEEDAFELSEELAVGLARRTFGSNR